MWDLLSELLAFFDWAGRQSDSSSSRVGESEFERESRGYWAKWTFGIALAALIAYGLFSLWAGN